MNGDNSVVTIGKLRAITAQARAVDAVEVWVYLPNTRGPVKCYIAGWSLKPPIADAEDTAPANRHDNILYLQVRPTPEPDPPAPDAVPAGIPTAPVEKPPDRGTAGYKKERVPNQEDLQT